MEKHSKKIVASIVHNSLSFVVMVATSSSQESIFFAVVHPTIKVVHIACQVTIFSRIPIGFAAFESPSTIFVTIMMITIHTCQQVIGWTLEINGLIKIIDIARPGAIVKLRNSFSARELIASVFTMVVMIALYSKNGLSKRTVNMKWLIKVILVTIHSIDC